MNSYTILLTMSLIVINLLLYLVFRIVSVNRYVVNAGFLLVGIGFGYMLYRQDPRSFGNLGWIIILICGWLNYQLIQLMRRYGHM